MKRQALKAITMLVSIVALAFITAVATNAQSQKLRANIPFDFVVGDKTLAAGEYMIRKATSDDNTGIIVRSTDAHGGAIRLTNTVKADTPAKRAMLVFNRYGSTYYLSQVWTAGSAEGREMLKSKAERSAESELARNSSSGEVAKSARLETVTIFAEIQ